MAFFSFGKRVRNQKFNFIPRHYDPAKEELEDRLRMASDESNPEVAKTRIKDDFKRGNKQLQSSVKPSANIKSILNLGPILMIRIKPQTRHNL